MLPDTSEEGGGDTIKTARKPREGKPVGELLGLSGCGRDAWRFGMKEMALSRANVFKDVISSPEERRRALTGFKVSASRRHGQSRWEDRNSIHQNANANATFAPRQQCGKQAA